MLVRGATDKAFETILEIFVCRGWVDEDPTRGVLAADVDEVRLPLRVPGERKAARSGIGLRQARRGPPELWTREGRWIRSSP